MDWIGVGARAGVGVGVVGGDGDGDDADEDEDEIEESGTPVLTQPSPPRLILLPASSLLPSFRSHSLDTQFTAF